MFKSRLVATALAASAAAIPASAAIIDIGDGKTFCESRGYSRSFAKCDLYKSTWFDLGSKGHDSITFEGSGTLAGAISGKWSDSASITLTSDSWITFTLAGMSDLFEALFTFGDLDVSGTVLSSEAPSVAFFANAGSYDFRIVGTASPQKSAYVMEVAAIPLPAGLALLLTGIGGLAVFRRKSS
ncbi:VPLPA-CTERM sorting domain-containing protein [Tropicimonas sp. TH_r6]|uniref:VPLPA-CTERM sorting domain-containing protein n=1 Tax=Tropicimonas sp. TH_r6 TaxID=3082085 RepID=UPI00295530D5|nr:VPLPA-CTERM sorting domain-containing protein [Tropicimonas sp. TH_r6]MDV7144882.1 VPLPA-CTERM sorting domain-containing protein [Tropicimonas sp. TH_r6]